MTLTKQFALNCGLSESSCSAEYHFRSTGLVRKCETTQYNTTELIQAKQITAAPMYRDMVNEKVVNRDKDFLFSSTGKKKLGGGGEGGRAES